MQGSVMQVCSTDRNSRSVAAAVVRGCGGNRCCTSRVKRPTVAEQFNSQLNPTTLTKGSTPNSLNHVTLLF